MTEQVDKAFQNGVEVGRIMFKMELGLPRVCNDGIAIRRDNKDAIVAMCKGLGYIPYFCPTHQTDYLGFYAIALMYSNN